MSGRLLPASLLILALIFFIPAIVLPLLQPSDTLTNLDGSISVIDHADIWDGMDPVSGAFYYVGDMICHQEKSRSFMLNGNQMYVCMRDISLLTGFIIGLLMVLSGSGLPQQMDRRLVTILTVLFLTTPLEWGMEHIFDVDLPLTRCITAVLSGVVFSLVLVRLIEKDAGTASK